jgi:sugar lactone lactonase YvrE
MEKLAYKENRSAYPIPENERDLPTVTAELFTKIPMDDVRPGANILEGICFDRRGDMYLVDCPMGRVYKIGMPEGDVHLFRQLPEHMAPSAIKIHRDGRIFATVAASDNGSMIIVMDPDSLCMDRDENLYVAMCGQGRFLVFDRCGVPIGQILIPGRDEGRMLKSTHIQIRPGTKEAYMCTADMTTGEAAVYRAGVFAEPFPSYQYQ